MKKIILLLAVGLTLAGCQSLQAFKTIYSIATESTVPAQTVIVAANAFDAVEATATNYLIYCKANIATSICMPDTRRKVIKYVRVGRAARNQLETSIASGTPASSAIYNTLVDSINTLNSTPIAGAAR